MIYPRSTIGTPTPPSDRDRLHRVNVLLAHHVGVGLASGSTRYRSADPARVLSDAKAVAAYGISAGKTWEYSYLIGLDGSIFTQAGEYRGSHCLNFNGSSAGVLFMNQDDVQVNAAQIAAWWEVRAHMEAQGIIANYIVAPHYRYRKTGCPGIRAEAQGVTWVSPTGEGRLGNLIPALTTPPPPPPSGDDVQAIEPIRLLEQSVAGGQQVFVPCSVSGSVFVNVTIADPVAGGWVYAGNSSGTSIVNAQVGAANSCCVPVGSLGGFYLTSTVACRLIVDLFGKSV